MTLVLVFVIDLVTYDSSSAREMSETQQKRVEVPNTNIYLKNTHNKTKVQLLFYLNCKLNTDINAALPGIVYKGESLKK